MKKTILAFISVSVFLCSSSAFAANYFTGKIGLYSPEESFLDDGFNIEGAYGIDISGATGVENLALELGLGYYTADGDQPFFDLDVSVIPITATAIYTHDLDGPFSLFGGAGLGFYYANVEVNSFGSEEDDSEVELGFNLVGGGRYELNNRMDLTAELKYAAVSDDIGGLFLNFGIKYNF
jgi:opacity protein-like surface antigen